MPVYWTIQARRHLRQSLAEALSREGGDQERLGVLERTITHLDAMLDDAFGGVAVVVKDQVVGYRRKKDLFTLLVEAFGPEDSIESGPFVVKIGPENRLRREIDGWERCRPPGLKHDLVFLGLRAKPPKVFDERSWICLVYGDAQQSLGVSFTVSFEEAALECVRSGFPKTASIVFVINQLFERIGHLFYQDAFPLDPAAKADDPDARPFVLDLPHLDEGLKRWETEPSCRLARNEANSMASSGVEQFLDPVDYLRYVQSYVPHIVTGQKEPRGATAIDTPEIDGLPRPSVINLVPRMLHGCSHGDLHGRNILVGIVRDQAMWPTVFDYEHMGRNAIGWDFVKFETELKMRAYTDVFADTPIGPFVRSVQAAEIELAKRTEEFHRHRSWPEAGRPAKPEERLATILLAIRAMAAQHLGMNHGRPNEWLEEYYFLLACYGTYTSRFENLQHRERIASLISAGVATSRLSWARTIG